MLFALAAAAEAAAAAPKPARSFPERERTGPLCFEDPPLEDDAGDPPLAASRACSSACCCNSSCFICLTERRERQGDSRSDLGRVCRRVRGCMDGELLEEGSGSRWVRAEEVKGKRAKRPSVLCAIPRSCQFLLSLPSRQMDSSEVNERLTCSSNAFFCSSRCLSCSSRFCSSFACNFGNDAVKLRNESKNGRSLSVEQRGGGDQRSERSASEEG